MRILIVSDSFKGSATSLEAADCIRAGFSAVFKDCDFRILPVADGGEGTVEAAVAGGGGTYHACRVQGPLGEPVEARFGVLPDGTAVMEMAQAAGLPLVPLDRRDPAASTTYGVGQMIACALDLGCRRILMGIGGSATNDGGAGMAAALGARFLDRWGGPLAPCGGALGDLASIDLSGLDPRLGETEVLVACDVSNPLCGPDGASAVYGPQKGASPALVKRLDAALAHYGDLLRAYFGRDFASLPGAGAAGGLGVGLMAFCGGTLYSGTQLIFRLLGLEEEIRASDLVITGEGRVDATSANGKLLAGLGDLTKKYHKPLIAFTGGIGPGGEQVQALGVGAVVPIADRPMPLEEALAEAPGLITAAAARTASLLKIGMGL